MDPAVPDASALCTDCGLCCGGLFGRVRLRPEDMPLAERAATPIVERDGALYATLPCTFLAGTVCTVYPERYAGCRSFICALLGRYLSGALDHAAAQTHIAEMRRLLGAWRDLPDDGTKRATAYRAVHHVAVDLYADRYFRNGKRRAPR